MYVILLCEQCVTPCTVVYDVAYIGPIVGICTFGNLAVLMKYTLTKCSSLLEHMKYYVVNLQCDWMMDQPLILTLSYYSQLIICAAAVLSMVTSNDSPCSL